MQQEIFYKWQPIRKKINQLDDIITNKYTSFFENYQSSLRLDNDKFNSLILSCLSFFENQDHFLETKLRNKLSEFKKYNKDEIIETIKEDITFIKSMIWKHSPLNEQELKEDKKNKECLEILLELLDLAKQLKD